VVESALRFDVGARIWLGEICERYSIDQTAALFSESTGRVLVSVGREDDVKFVGLCEARGIPVLRVGVTQHVKELEIQDIVTFTLSELRKGWTSTIPALFD
jgi:phosphoribosylformylglycinamidine synthase